MGTGKEEQLDSSESEVFSASVVISGWPAAAGSAYSEISTSLMSIVWRFSR